MVRAKGGWLCAPYQIYDAQGNKQQNDQQNTAIRVEPPKQCYIIKSWDKKRERSTSVTKAEP